MEGKGQKGSGSPSLSRGPVVSTLFLSLIWLTVKLAAQPGTEEGEATLHHYECITMWSIEYQFNVSVMFRLLQSQNSNCGCFFFNVSCCRATGPVTRTGTPSSERSPGTRATWRSPPRSQRSCSRRTGTAAPRGCPSSSCISGSRGRRRAGSTRPTATPRSAWRAETSATTAGQPRWAECACVSECVCVSAIIICITLLWSSSHRDI